MSWPLHRPDRGFDTGLAEAVEAMARALRSGASALQAVEEAAAVVPMPVAADLRSVSDRVRRGLPLGEAFDGWAADRDGPSVRLVAAAFGLGLEAGGPLAMALDGVALTLRQRLAIGDEVDSLSAQAHLSALVIAAAPIGFLLMASASDRRTIAFLVGTPAGLVCLVAGVALDVIGALWMRILARVEP